MSRKEFKVRSFRQQGWWWSDDDYINGYARHLDPYATAVYMSLCRHADKNGECFPSVRKLAKQHNISPTTIQNKLNLLEEHNLFKKKTGGRKKDGTFKRSTYWLTDKTEWKNYQCHQVVQDGSPVPSDEPDQYHQVVHKETHIEGNTYNSDASVANINELIELFKPINPSYKRLFKNKTQRGAIERLVKEHGEQKIRNLLAVLPDIVSQEYAPSITTPYQLEKKMGRLKVFLQRKQKNNSNVVAI